MPSDAAAGVPQQLHPSSLVFNVGKWVRRLIVPGLIVLVLGRGEEWEIWAMIGVIIPIAVETYRFLTLRYLITDDEIVVREGILEKSERHIPFDRIQSIDLVQNAFQRPFDLAEVRIETAGGAKPEAVLSVLHLDDVEAMRRRVFAGRSESLGPGTAVADDDSNVLVRVPTADLARLGIISNRGWGVVALAMGLVWQFDLSDEFGELGALAPSVDGASLVSIILVGTLLVVVGLGALYLFSIVWTIVRLHDYMVLRSGDDLQLRCGLLTRRSATVPRHRIQLVLIKETMLQRWFDRVTVRVETAAGQQQQSGNSEASLSQKWLIPIVPRSQLPRILDALRPGLVLPEENDWQPMSLKGKKRFLKKVGLLALLMAAIPVAAVPAPWGIVAGLVVLAVVAWSGWRVTRYQAWADDRGRMFFRTGAWTRQISFAFDNTLQVVSIEQSPFDRRRQHAKLRLDTAGSNPLNQGVVIPYLDLVLARSKLQELSDRMAVAQARW